MKLLLIQPPIQDFYDTSIRLQPLGLCCLKAALRERLPELQVIIKDYHHGWGKQSIPLPKELAYLRPYYPVADKSPFSLFYHYYHFGVSFERIEKDLKQEAPDIVGISSLFSPYYREALKTAEAVKRSTGALVVLGGGHPSVLPEEVLSSPAVDFVIRGEGETALVRLLIALRDGTKLEEVPSLAFKQNGRCQLNPLAENLDIAELPPPDFSDFSVSDFLFEDSPLSFITTSRGCPLNCSFCAVRSVFGPCYREVPLAQIFSLLEARYQEGIRFFDFEDDNIFVNRNRAKQLLEGLISRFRGKGVRFSAMNGISYFTLDAELLSLMKEAGFTSLNLSLVSANEAVSRRFARPLDAKRFQHIALEAFRLGLSTVSYQILGLPGESLPSMISTLRLTAELPVLLGASPFYLTPGTPIAAELKADYPAEPFLARLSALAISTPHCSRDQLYTLFLSTRIINFLKGLPIEGQLSLEQALKQAENLSSREALGANLFRRLVSEHSLYAFDGRSYHLLTRFCYQTFSSLWRSLSSIRLQNGSQIDLNTD